VNLSVNLRKTKELIIEEFQDWIKFTTHVPWSWNTSNSLKKNSLTIFPLKLWD